MKTLPEATVTHCMKGRVRINIAGIETRKEHYLNELSQSLNQEFNYRSIRVNRVTGSLLLEDPGLDLDAVVRHGSENGLFRMNARADQVPVTVARVARTQVNRIDDCIRKLTGGTLDMPGSVFVLLIVHAMREIIRGELAIPSWFTALWFASTIYNRDFYGPGSEGGHAHGDSIHAHDDGDSHAE